MATPCCPKCSKTRFLRSKNAALQAWMVYCGHCGAVAGILPAESKAAKASTGGRKKPGTTAQSTGSLKPADDWESP